MLTCTVQLARKRGWCEFADLHFDIACVLESEKLGSKPSITSHPSEPLLPQSLEHQNLRVEAVIPGHHQALLDQQAAQARNSHRESSGDLTEPLLVPRASDVEANAKS